MSRAGNSLGSVLARPWVATVGS